MSIFPEGAPSGYRPLPMYYPSYPPSRKDRHPTSLRNADPAFLCPKRRHFSVWRAGKETVKGMFRPLVTLFKHPVKSAFALGVTLVLASVAPVTLPVMVLAGLGMGAFQTVKGVTVAIRQGRQGHYAAAEKAFGDIGEGAMALISSLLGVRRAGMAAAESKAAAPALNAAIKPAARMAAVEEGLLAAKRVQLGSWQTAWRETCSVFTAASGTAWRAQLSPVRLATLAQGKTLQLLARLRQPLMVDLGPMVEKAQAFLKIPNQEMPAVVPNLADKGVQAFYRINTHAVHFEPNRMAAFQSSLGVFSDLLITKLPLSLRRFLLGRYVQRNPMQEAVTHELTHARQWSALRRLSQQQALDMAQQAFPDEYDFLLQNIVKHLSLKGNLKAALEGEALVAARKALLDRVRFECREMRINVEVRATDDPLAKARAGLADFQNYVRAGYEVEARQMAAEHLMAQAAEALANAQGFAAQQALGRYRAQKLESLLNRTLQQLNELEQTESRIAQADKLAELKALQSLASGTSTTTGDYLRQESVMENRLRNEARMLKFQDRLQAVQSGKTSLWQTARSFFSGAWSRLRQWFSPVAWGRFEQQRVSRLGRVYLNTATAWDAPAFHRPPEA